MLQALNERLNAFMESSADMTKVMRPDPMALDPKLIAAIHRVFGPSYIVKETPHTVRIHLPDTPNYYFQFCITSHDRIPLLGFTLHYKKGDRLPSYECDRRHILSDYRQDAGIKMLLQPNSSMLNNPFGAIINHAPKTIRAWENTAIPTLQAHGFVFSGACGYTYSLDMVHMHGNVEANKFLLEAYPPMSPDHICALKILSTGKDRCLSIHHIKSPDDLREHMDLALLNLNIQKKIALLDKISTRNKWQLDLNGLEYISNPYANIVLFLFEGYMQQIPSVTLDLFAERDILNQYLLITTTDGRKIKCSLLKTESEIEAKLESILQPIAATKPDTDTTSNSDSSETSSSSDDEHPPRDSCHQRGGSGRGRHGGGWTTVVGKRR
jgi:hypothetical protein